ncbi:MAG: hypothetical protein P4N59_27940 [Negativicutes bacterium]|nr:hypothetical protein [Negativicutes bacterium]
MYKLIIGNVRITVLGDDVTHEQAATMARQAIAAASRQGKLLSHIEISTGEYGPEIKTSEKVGHKVVRKTIKQSMLDSIHTAAREKLFPNNAFTSKDSWFDGDTGQEWSGEMVSDAREELITKLEVWIKTV